MKFCIRLLTFLTSAALLLGCASSPNAVAIDPSNIAEKFDVSEVTTTNMLDLTRSCLGANIQTQVTESLLKDFPIRSGFSVVSNSQSKNYAYFFASSMTCIRQTARGYPILAAEAFNRTVVPVGVPDSIKLEWDKKIAARIASHGTARVLYLYNNGNGHSAIYWVKLDDKGVLHYGSDFKRAGQFQVSDYDFQFSHPNITSVSTVSYQNGTVYRKGFMQHRVNAVSALNTGGNSAPTRATPLPK